MTQYLYRAEHHIVSCIVDAESEIYGTQDEIVVIRFPVLSVTPKGYWIGNFGKKRWVPREGRKLYAWTSRPLALASLIERKKRQIQIYQARVSAAEQIILKVARNEVSRELTMPSFVQ